MMKCDENGGCPFGVEVRGERQCWVTPSFVKRCNEELRYKRCRLASADFPIITAMIAGEYDCKFCSVTGDFGDGVERPCPCREDAPLVDTASWPCEGWRYQEPDKPIPPSGDSEDPVAWIEQGCAGDNPCSTCGGRGFAKVTSATRARAKAGMLPACPTCHGTGKWA